MSNLSDYNKKRDFKRTAEPRGVAGKRSGSRLIFCVQHHMARKEHYDLRLEWGGVLLSWAVPKGPSYNPKDKRLSIMVEEHPVSYAKFEGVIPKGQYGGGTVMLWDEGYWRPHGDVDAGLKDGAIKFTIQGKRLKGNWMLTTFNTKDKQNTWLLIKERDEFADVAFDIKTLTTSIKTGRTMQEIAAGKLPTKVNIKKKTAGVVEVKNGQRYVHDVAITSPDKLIYSKPKTTKLDVVLYYAYMLEYIFPYLKKRPVSCVRCPNGGEEECFYFRNLTKGQGNSTPEGYGLLDGSDGYFYITDAKGFINLVQLGTLEFHMWGAGADNIDRPNVMVFDLDPDENLPIKQLRQGVRHLKEVLDNLKVVSFLKTSGNKGYHVVVPFMDADWKTFRAFAKNVAAVMAEMWPHLYTDNSRIKNRKNKIYIDWLRNTKGATSIAPYSLRVGAGARVSMPIAWEELGRVRPNAVTIKSAVKRVLKEDPWQGFFNVKQGLQGSK